MRLLVKFLKLSLADKALLADCVLILAMVRIGLSLLSYRTLRRYLQKEIIVPVASNDEARRIVWAVTNAARIVPRASCLTQAVAAQFLLARAGYQSQMRVGVSTDAEGQFIAHAWLISEGRILMGGSAREIRRFATLTDFNLGPQ